MTRHLGILMMAALCTGRLAAQTSTTGNAQASNAKTNPWDYNLSVSGTIVAHGPSFVSPVFTADHDWLHLEGRYNYEAQRTGSLWVGYDFNVGKKVTLEATPMLGGVFGDVTGVAPGLEFTATYKKWQLYSANEYIVDTDTGAASFFYTWTQLTYSPVPWFSGGYVMQRTRAYTTALDVQRGLYLGFTHKKLNFSTQIFNFGWIDPTWVFAMGYSF